ncbi:hypothetical protein HG530_006792 [Fusarium avenaceum]|nr:hypothetical protein HG530_006792 [Fusarium avenaceum]
MTAARTFLSGIRNLLADSLLLLVVVLELLADALLEEERTLLHLGVHLAIDEDTGVDVLLSVGAEVLILGHDALVKLGDEVEVIVARVLVAEELVAHGGAGRAVGDEALDHEEMRRDVGGGIGKVVSDSNAESAVNLILSLSTKVLDVRLLCLDPVGVEVGNGGDIRVSNLAVVALVVVVGEDLPVVVTLHLPDVVEVVVVKVVVREALVGIEIVKVILPGDLRDLGTVHVDPDEATGINLDVNGKKTVLGLVKAGAGITVVTLLRSDNGESTEAGDVVEGVDVVVLILGNDKLEVGDLILEPVAGLLESGLVCGEEPLLGEDGTLLELVHLN